MSISITLQQMGVICILVLIGALLEKKSILDPATSRKLSAIVVDVCNPALIMASILDGNVTASHTDLIRGLVLGVSFYLLLMLLGPIIPFILRIEPQNQWIYKLMTVYTNTGFLGIPIARAILPPNAIIYVIIINVLYSLLFYTHGLIILEGGHKNIGKRAPHPLHIFTPGTIMAVLSLVIFWFNLSLPPIIQNSIGYIGHATVFLSMILLGASISRSNIRTTFTDKHIWGFIVIRMILLPIAVVAMLSLLSYDKTATLALCLMTAVPVGNLPMIQAEKMGMNTTILSSAIAVTTLVSMATITILIAWATSIL